MSITLGATLDSSRIAAAPTPISILEVERIFENSAVSVYTVAEQLLKQAGSAKEIFQQMQRTFANKAISDQSNVLVKLQVQVQEFEALAHSVNRVSEELLKLAGEVQVLFQKKEPTLLGQDRKWGDAIAALTRTIDGIRSEAATRLNTLRTEILPRLSAIKVEGDRQRWIFSRVANLSEERGVRFGDPDPE